ncbi:type II toxin-antitoxin system VapC family toxin [Tersicoccus sp. MR15.9]|uniref:type II toxin-antitoxin system VapC family toxin n=1 Tax=Tersicoccus mangrovi TaxID=3121635 RepID=UPI002FE56DE2
MGVSYLLDTHVLLWLLGDPGRVPASWRARLADPETTLIVSAASALEVATKERLGKLHAPGLVAGWDDHLRSAGMSSLSITSRHATVAGTLNWQHRDPFDRNLVAQAQCEGHVLLTVDREVLAYGDVTTATW